jgi:hypothetical protein
VVYRKCGKIQVFVLTNTTGNEEVEAEAGRELPPGVDDPSKVSEADLRPIRHHK